MDEEIFEIINTLEELLEELPSKPRLVLEKIIADIKNLKIYNIPELIKIQDKLEVFSNMTNIDSFSRNEVINVLSLIETLI